MSSARIEHIATQRIANAIEVIAAYEAKIYMAHDSMDQVKLADRSLTSTEFSLLSDIVPTALDTKYTTEPADGKSIGTDSIIRGCTLNFLNHLFDIDLMLIELGSFDVIIGMDLLSKYHDVIIFDEKVVRIPYGNEVLTIHRDGNDDMSKSKLSIISCTKPHTYIQKRCYVFLAQINEKKAKYKLEEKRLEDVSIVRDVPEVFPEDFPGL
nr:reverse transcriptase domain-containing protein [Tanacetum cinerariifolium]